MVGHVRAAPPEDSVPYGRELRNLNKDKEIRDKCSRLNKYSTYLQCTPVATSQTSQKGWTIHPDERIHGRWYRVYRRMRTTTSAWRMSTAATNHVYAPQTKLRDRKNANSPQHVALGAEATGTYHITRAADASPGASLAPCRRSSLPGRVCGWQRARSRARDEVMRRVPRRQDASPPARSLRG